MKKYLLFLFYFIYPVLSNIPIFKSASFPIYENEIFRFKILPNTSYYQPQTILKIGSYCKNNLTENHFLFPGHLSKLKKPLIGEYFDIINFISLPNQIEVSMKFHRLINNCNLIISYKNTNDALERYRIEKEHNLYVIKVLKIQLYLHWTLNLYQQTADYRKGGFVPDYRGHLICDASNGYPLEEPNLTGLIDLVNYDSGYVHKSNLSISFKFKVDLKDHGKIIKCWAGRDFVSINVKVYHHAKSIESTPPINNWVQNGTSVLCHSSTGYPRPSNAWAFVSGPPEASSYYEIDSSRPDILRIKSNAPPLSSWTFSCSANNTIPGVINKGLVREFRFKIGKEPLRPIYIFLITSICVVILVAAIIFIYKFRMVYYHKKSQVHEDNNDLLSIKADAQHQHPTNDEEVEYCQIKKDLKLSNQNPVPIQLTNQSQSSIQLANQIQEPIQLTNQSQSSLQLANNNQLTNHSLSSLQLPNKNGSSGENSLKGSRHSWRSYGQIDEV